MENCDRETWRGERQIIETETQEHSQHMETRRGGETQEAQKQRDRDLERCENKVYLPAIPALRKLSQEGFE